MESMLQLQVEGNVYRIPQHILVSLVLREHMEVISDSEMIKWGKVANKITITVCRDNTFVECVETTLNFAIASEEVFGKAFVVSHIMDIVKAIVGSEFLTEMITKSYY